MNELIISLLPTQKSYATMAVQIDIWNAVKRIETNRTPQIIKARNCEKGDDYYEHIKEGSPHFIFGSMSGKDKKIANIQKYTGLVYCDIDQDDIAQCGYSLSELKNAIFDRYACVLFCSISFGGKGLGFVLYCPDLISYNAPNAYEQAYKSFASIINNDFEVKLNLDSVCFNPNRQTTLSYDTEILFREHPLAYKFDYDAALPYNGGKVTEREIDLSLKKNDKLFSMFIERFHDYYASLSWIEIETGRPVIYQEGLKFDKDKYYISRHFNQNVLMEFDLIYRNESETLVYIPSGIAATTLITGTNFKVKHGSRENFMQSFVLNYIFILKANNKAESIGKFYVYNLLLALNTMMYDKTGSKHTPLLKNEINLLTQVIMEKIVSGAFLPSISKKSHIRTDDFMSKVSRLYKNGAKPRNIIVNEINKIKHRIQNRLFDKYVEEYEEVNPDWSPKELTTYLLNTLKKPDGKPYKLDTIERKVRKKVSFPDSLSSIKSGEATKEERQSESDTFQRITRCVDQLMAMGEKVKQKEVINLLSKYMCRSTVLRHWPKIKEKVKSHNKAMKEGNYNSKTISHITSPEDIKSWVIYRGAIKTMISFNLGDYRYQNNDSTNQKYFHTGSAVGDTIFAVRFGSA